LWRDRSENAGSATSGSTIRSSARQKRCSSYMVRCCARRGAGDAVIGTLVPEPLRFLATGETQHVFVAAGDDQVVYKIPAVFVELRPGAFSLPGFKPVQPWKARLWASMLRRSPRLMRTAGGP